MHYTDYMHRSAPSLLFWSLDFLVYVSAAHVQYSQGVACWQMSTQGNAIYKLFCRPELTAKFN